jgi:ubiquinone/menaquinone biosynthesis C-methylase UbiE
MEGPLATWYAKTTGKDLAEFERLARQLAAGLPAGARVLEVAPGPGFLSVALAKLGPYDVTGVDISESFVRMATEYVRKENVSVRFIHGSASDLPLEANCCDLIVCRAAFKNFSEPLRAINEMHRVLKPGGQALIIDLCKDASWKEIVSYVDGLKLSRTSAFMTKFTFKHMLLKRAYTEESMKALAATSDFGSCEITRNAVGMEVRFRRSAVAQQVA